MAAFDCRQHRTARTTSAWLAKGTKVGVGCVEERRLLTEGAGRPEIAKLYRHGSGSGGGQGVAQRFFGLDVGHGDEDVVGVDRPSPAWAGAACLLCR